MFFMTNTRSDVFTLLSYILNSINLLLKCLKTCCMLIFFSLKAQRVNYFNVILLNCSMAPPAAAQMGRPCSQKF